jgi:hypothetical protein
MNIAHELQQVGVSINQYGPVSPFKQMPGPLHPFVRRPGVLCTEPSHQMGQRPIADLHGHVNVVGHPAIGMDAASITFQSRSEEGHPAVTIRVGKEDSLSVITPQDDMVKATGHVQSRFARHPRLLIGQA